MPEPDAGYISYEALPAITPEVDVPAEPGEDTNEIEPIGAETGPEQAAGHDEPPPPTPLRPAAGFGSGRPFGEGASFRSAIDAARERVHGAAREATPEDGESGDPDDDRSQG